MAWLEEVVHEIHVPLICGAGDFADSLAELLLQVQPSILASITGVSRVRIDEIVAVGSVDELRSAFGGDAVKAWQAVLSDPRMVTIREQVIREVGVRNPEVAREIAAGRIAQAIASGTFFPGARSKKDTVQGRHIIAQQYAHRFNFDALQRDHVEKAGRLVEDLVGRYKTELRGFLKEARQRFDRADTPAKRRDVLKSIQRKAGLLGDRLRGLRATTDDFSQQFRGFLAETAILSFREGVDGAIDQLWDLHNLPGNDFAREKLELSRARTERRRKDLGVEFFRTNGETLRAALANTPVLAGRVSRQALEGIQDIITRTSILRGEHSTFAAKEILRDYGRQLEGLRLSVGARARFIARTETARAQAEGDLAAQGRLGVEWVDIFYSEGAGICEICPPIAAGGPYPRDRVPEGGIPFHPNCFPLDTEILTKRGWAPVAEVAIGEEVFALDPERLRLGGWVRVVNRVRYHHTGEMVHFSDVRNDILVTPNHMMFVGTRSTADRKARKWRLEEAELVEKRGEFSFFRSGAEWTGDSSAELDTPIGRVSTAWWFRFLAAFISDGSIAREDQFSIAQQDPWGKGFLDAIFKCLRLRVWRGQDYYGGRHRKLVQWLAEHVGRGAANKRIPEVVRSASRELIRDFLDTYLQFDGYEREASGFGKNSEKTYFTTSPVLAADLGELIVKVGNFPSYSVDHARGRTAFGAYRQNHDVIWVRETTSRTAGYVRSRRNGGIKIERVPWDDEVACVELEKYHVMLVRRNGKVAWCGNCQCTYAPFLPEGRGSVESLLRRGENREASGLAFVQVEGREYALLSERTDGSLMIPTGPIPRNADGLGPAKQAATRELRMESGLHLGSPIQIGKFEAPGRDPRARSPERWASTRAFLFDVGEADELPGVRGEDDPRAAKWFRIEEALERALHADHKSILRAALRAKAANRLP